MNFLSHLKLQAFRETCTMSITSGKCVNFYICGLKKEASLTEISKINQFLVTEFK